MELNVPRVHRENSSNPCVEEQLKRHWANFIRRSYSRVFLKFISRAILRPEDLEETATATSGVLSLTHGGASFVYFHSGVPSKNVLRRRAQHRTQLVPVVGMLLPGIGRAPILFQFLVPEIPIEAQASSFFAPLHGFFHFYFFSIQPLFTIRKLMFL